MWNGGRDLWPEEAIEAIHEATLAVLERLGVQVESPAARDILLAAGCTAGPGNRILMARGVVMDAVDA